MKNEPRDNRVEVAGLLKTVQYQWSLWPHDNHIETETRVFRVAAAMVLAHVSRYSCITAAEKTNLKLYTNGIMISLPENTKFNQSQ